MKKRYLSVAAFSILLLNAAVVDFVIVRDHRPAPIPPPGLEIKVVHCEGDVTPLQAYYIALETLKHVPVKSGRFQVTIRLLHVTETKGRIEVALGSSDLQISFVSVQDWEWARPGAELTAMGCAEADLVGKIRSWQRESAIPARREEKQ